MQYSLTVEHSRWDTGFRVSYIGTNTRQGDYGFNYNSPVPDGRLYINKPRPFPQYPAINYFTNGAGHQFHGFTSEVERRLAHGLQFQSSWVVGPRHRRPGARAIARKPLRSPAGAQRSARYPDAPVHDQLDLSAPLRQRAAVPQLRSPGGERYRRRMGYQRNLQLLFRAVSHRLLDRAGSDGHSLYEQRHPPDCDDPAGSAARSAICPAISAPSIAGSTRSAFAGPPVGRFGTSSKGVIIGPHVNVWHMGFFKSFYFTETIRLRWELTATNFFNHPNYSNPATNISQAGSCRRHLGRRRRQRGLDRRPARRTKFPHGLAPGVVGPSIVREDRACEPGTTPGRSFRPLRESRQFRSKGSAMRKSFCVFVLLSLCFLSASSVASTADTSAERTIPGAASSLRSGHQRALQQTLRLDQKRRQWEQRKQKSRQRSEENVVA